MKRRILTGLALLVAAGSTILFNGCCVIGFGVGDAIDGSKLDQLSVNGWKEETIKSGSQMEIFLKDGTQLSGKYVGLERVSEEEYAERYAKSRKQNLEEVILPLLGDSIIFSGVSTEEARLYEFLGFGYKTVMLKVAGSTDISEVRLDVLRYAEDSCGNVFELEAIEKLISEGKIPLLSAIVIQSEAGRREVAIENVYQIQVHIKRHGGRWMGLLVGAAVDAIVFFYVLPEITSIGGPYNIGFE